nr:hypothetical protein [uncultured Blautia sp.]
MQFFAVVALTATLVTGQFTYVPVMAGSTAEVQVSSLIPDNVTVEQPVPLSEISLPKSDYGTLSWVDSSSVPSKRVQSYDVVFRPYKASDLAKFSGWDGQSDTIYSSVTVVVSSFSKDTDYTDNGYENQGSQEAQENGDTGENGEDTTTETPGNTEISDNGEVKDESEAKDQDTPDTVDADDTADKTQDTVETPDNKDVSADTEKNDSADVTETPEVTAAPDDAENPEVTETPETTETPDVTATPDVTETPEITETPEADKDNIFDGTEKDIVPDQRAQTVAEEEPSDEEKIELAATNHTCNGISVSGINLPWYVQFRAASGENYEFSNEAEANLFKSYEFELWDLKNNTEYEIPDGEYISVTVPVKAGYDYTIEHLLDSGAMETIVPSVDGSTMVFSTHSFSPFGIAGSKTLVGEEIEDGSYSSGTTTTASTTVSPATAASSSTTTATNNSTSGTSVQSSSDQSGTDNSTSDQGTQSGSSSVKAVSTGDSTPILPFVIIGIAAAVIVAVLVYLKKRK